MTATMTAPNRAGIARRARLPAWTDSGGYRSGWRGGATDTLYTWTWTPDGGEEPRTVTTYGTIFKDGDDTYTHKIDAPRNAAVRLATMAEARAAGWGRNWKCSDGVTV